MNAAPATGLINARRLRTPPAELYGVTIVERLARGRQAGPTIVVEASRRGSQIIVIGATRKSERMRREIFGGTVDYVLKHATCRVIVVSASAPSV
jgi:nucleotide-binding universal stress UspA family protein